MLSDNRHRRRALAARVRKGLPPLPMPPSPFELPLVQMSMPSQGAHGKPLTFSALGLRDYFSLCLLEHAERQPIADETFEALAHALRVELTEALRHQIYAAVVGTALMITRGWHSPRATLRLLKKLKRDGLQKLTDAQSQNDSWAEFVIRAVQEEARARQLPVDFILSRHIEALREMVPPGRPDEEARSMLFETAAAIACDYDAGLALPTRDDSRGLTSTPLFEFGAAMVDLVVDYGNAMLARQQLPPGRFDGLAKREGRRGRSTANSATIIMGTDALCRF